MLLDSPDVVRPEPVADLERALGARPADLLLVSLPFGPPRQPSLGLGLLQALVPEVSSRSLYLNLAYAREIGWDLYQDISGRRFKDHSLVGEWIFSAALGAPGSQVAPGSPAGPTDGSDADRSADAFLDRVAAPASAQPLSPEDRETLRGLHREAGAFLDRCVDLVVAHRPTVVGVTSVFQQHAASLAFARRLKAALPEVFVLFGGANCEGPMGQETVRSFPWVDAVFSGEADRAFPELLARLLGGEAVDDLPGVVTRRGLAEGIEPVNGPRLRHLDELPHPAYEDFFEQWEQVRDAASEGPRLLFETSRGCWWGEKQHCTFCGLNGSSMAFRSKSAERALSELTELVTAHPDCSVLVVDSILDMSYFGDFLPALEASDLDVPLFYEVKANLKKEHLRQLRASGIREIQPGIESFSDAVLRLMRKGVSGLQNIQLLKWCRELGIWPSWHLLWGFPGEAPEEYRRMAELLPLLHHLAPPAAACPIRLHRFSPNYEQWQELGFDQVRPAAAYGHVYGLPEPALANLAYYFDYDYADGRRVESYVGDLAEAAAVWREGFQTAELVAAEQGDALLLWDLRACARRPLTRLTGKARELYLACDGIRRLKALGEAGEVEDLLGPLVEAGLMLREGDRFLSLAVASAGARKGAPGAVLAEAEGI